MNPATCVHPRDPHADAQLNQGFPRSGSQEQFLKIGLVEQVGLRVSVHANQF